MNRDAGPFLYRLAKSVLSRPLHSAYEIDVDGIGHVPDSGGVIVAANHRSFMDSVFLALVVKRPVSFLAKAEYFDHRRTAWLFRATGQIPVRRGSPAAARRALDAALAVLNDGGVVGVFPEGTRSRDGRLHRGNLGPARLAVAAGVPIVPVGLVGTEAVQPPDQRLPRIGLPVGVHLGLPRWPDPEPAERRAHLRALTDQVMSDIADLSDPHYEHHAPALITA